MHPDYPGGKGWPRQGSPASAAVRKQVSGRRRGIGLAPASDVAGPARTFNLGKGTGLSVPTLQVTSHRHAAQRLDLADREGREI